MIGIDYESIKRKIAQEIDRLGVSDKNLPNLTTSERLIDILIIPTLEELARGETYLDEGLWLPGKHETKGKRANDEFWKYHGCSGWHPTLKDYKRVLYKRTKANNRFYTARPTITNT